jgi:alanyl-tRNA synthetase
LTVAERVAGPEFAATVTDIRLDSRDAAGTWWQVALDRTAFEPGEVAGVLVAVARSGAKLEVAVERAEEDVAGEVWHFVRKPLPVGIEVVGRVESRERREI